MEFSKNLRRLRKAAGLTQEALAERLHLTGQAVSRWETGEGYPEITLLPSLADLLGVTVDALLRNAELTPEELYSIEGEALRLEQTGNREGAITLLEEQLRLHPEADELRDRLSSVLMENVYFLRKEGKHSQAENTLRRAEEVAEAQRTSDDPWLSFRAQAKLPEIYYRLREKEKLKKLRPVTLDPYYLSLSNCIAGKDRLYVYERAVLDTVFSLNIYLENLAYQPPKGSARFDQDPGELLIYEPHPGEGEWEFSLEERYEIERFRGELLERFSGGEGFGLFRGAEITVLSMRLRLAAEMQDRERLLETLELFVERFAVRNLVEWERKRVLALDSYRLALVGQQRRGSETPEADAIALLSPSERELMTEPVSPIPALKHLQLCRVLLRDPPALPFRLQETVELLKKESFDFLRQEPRFRAAEEALAALVKELEAEGDLPPKNLEARRGI